jgi:hypothetical protein
MRTELRDLYIRHVLIIHLKESPTTTMNICLSVLFAVALLLMASGQAPSDSEPYVTGNRVRVSTSDPYVVSAAKFALSDRYVLDSVDYKILSAEQQMVAGKFFWMDISVAESGPTFCTLMRYKVWDQFNGSYEKLDNTQVSQVSQQCDWLPVA